MVVVVVVVMVMVVKVVTGEHDAYDIGGVDYKTFVAGTGVCGGLGRESLNFARLPVCQLQSFSNKI